MLTQRKLAASLRGQIGLAVFPPSVFLRNCALFSSFRSNCSGPIKQKLLSRVVPTGVGRRFPETEINHYWGHAHVTPTFCANGESLGFHSNRRVPDPGAVQKIKPIYRKLKEIEDGGANRATGSRNRAPTSDAILAQAGVTYDQFVFSLAS